MFVFEYIEDDYQSFINAMSKQANVPLINNTLFFPPEIATGYFRMLDLPNQLQVMLSDITLNCDWYLHRKPADEVFYVLHFDAVITPDTLIASFDDGSLTENVKGAVIFLTSSIFDFSYYGHKGTRVKGINIIIKKEWLSEYLGLKSVDELLQNYIALKAKSLTSQVIDREYNLLMNEILDSCDKTSFSNLFLINRIQLLIERFFKQLYNNAQNVTYNVTLSNADINRLVTAEHYLTGNYHEKPPSINELARMSNMSPTKFKNNFKLLYGKPVYSYFQHQRLNKAREYLVTGKLNVNEIVEAVGFYNMSNFVAAFKKHFDMLPGDVLQN